MTDETNKKEAILAKAISKMLKPLARLLIHQDITYVGLQNLLKRTFVEVAVENCTLKNKRITDSRISLLTGIHRGDVKRIRTEHQNQPTEKELKASLSSQIMSVWVGHQGYLDDNGEPLDLYRHKEDGAPSFEELVLSISKDKHPRSILDEWIEQNLVEIFAHDDAEKIKLNKVGYVPAEDFEEKLFFAGKNIGSHLTTVAHNLENQQPTMFDRAVYYTDLTEESIQEIESVCNQRMMELLTEINQLASQLQEQDNAKAESQYEMHIGGYFNHTLVQPKNGNSEE